MSYREISRKVRPFIFLLLGAFFLTLAPQHFAIDPFIRISFGILLIAYGVFRFVGLFKVGGKLGTIILLLTSQGCSDHIPESRTPILIHHPAITELIEAEWQVFNSLYPNVEIEFAELDSVSFDDLNNTSGIVASILSENLKRRIESDRKMSIDSTAIILSPNSYQQFRVFDYELGSSNVRAFTAFIAGPKGQLIAHKLGYIPIHTPKREVKITTELEGLTETR